MQQTQSWITSWQARASGRTLLAMARRSENQKKSKAEAQKKSLIFARAPQFVLDTWNQICQLKGRGRDKNRQKQEFTHVSFADTPCEDIYKQTSVEDKSTLSYSKDGTWVMSEKAEEEHGAGCKGR